MITRWTLGIVLVVVVIAIGCSSSPTAPAQPEVHTLGRVELGVCHIKFGQIGELNLDENTGGFIMQIISEPEPLVVRTFIRSAAGESPKSVCKKLRPLLYRVDVAELPPIKDEDAEAIVEVSMPDGQTVKHSFKLYFPKKEGEEV